MVVRVLEREGATMWDRGSIYKAVAHLVILYAIESWLVKGGMLKLLEGFYHRAAQQITGLMAKCEAGGEWEYP